MSTQPTLLTFPRHVNQQGGEGVNQVGAAMRREYSIQKKESVQQWEK